MNTPQKQPPQIPQLRFPEFKGEWREGKLGSVFNISAGGDIDKKHIKYNKTGEFKYPIYANAAAKKGLYGYADIYKVEPNVITVAGRGVNIGIAHARDHKFYPIVRLLILKPKKDQNIYFFEYRINKLDLFIESTGVPQLTAPQISGYRIGFPSLEEQQKIASFLTAVDQRLELLRKKKAQLEQYKKGAMQKLFSQELRFKDSNSQTFPEWEEKRLGEVCEIKKGKQLNKELLTEEGDYPCQNGGIEPSGYTDKFNSEKDTITISEGGNSCGYINWMKTRFWCGGHCYTLVNLAKYNSPLFLFQLLKFEEHNIMRLRVGSGLPNIQKSDIQKFALSLPNQQEQQKIAAFLSSIDEAIAEVERQIEKTAAWKKGLLQQMFV